MCFKHLKWLAWSWHTAVADAIADPLDLECANAERQHLEVWKRQGCDTGVTPLQKFDQLN